MGIEYCHYLLPRPNSFLPTAAQMKKYLAELVAQKWIPEQDRQDDSETHARALMAFENDGCTGRTLHMPLTLPLSEQEIAVILMKDARLEWRIRDPLGQRLRYPLLPHDRWIEIEGSLAGIYYSIIFQWSPQYISQDHGTCIYDHSEPRCNCGRKLEVVFDRKQDRFPRELYSLYYSTCPDCGKAIDLSTLHAVAMDGRSGDRFEFPGGAFSRFAIQVDCGKGYPSHDAIRLEPDFVELFWSIFECDCVQLGGYN
jgi:hypothetical protein